MSRRPGDDSFEAKLQLLELQIQQLSLLVQQTREEREAERRDADADALIGPREPTTNDRVRFRIRGRAGQFEGTVIGNTPHFLQVLPDGSDTYVLRAPHSVTLLPPRDGRRARSARAANSRR
jgi:hypothetical protein